MATNLSGPMIILLINVPLALSKLLTDIMEIKHRYSHYRRQPTNDPFYLQTPSLETTKVCTTGPLTNCNAQPPMKEIKELLGYHEICYIRLFNL